MHEDERVSIYRSDDQLEDVGQPVRRRRCVAASGRPGCAKANALHCVSGCLPQGRALTQSRRDATLARLSAVVGGTRGGNKGPAEDRRASFIG